MIPFLVSLSFSLFSLSWVRVKNINYHNESSHGSFSTMATWGLGNSKRGPPTSLKPHHRAGTPAVINREAGRVPEKDSEQKARRLQASCGHCGHQLERESRAAKSTCKNRANKMHFATI